jgi:hypothetical protein
MTPAISPSFTLNKKFLAGEAEASVELSAPDAPTLMRALRSTTDWVPAGNLVLGKIRAKAGGESSIEFGDPKRKVAICGEAEAGFGLGIYAAAGDAIRTSTPAPELAEAIALAEPAATRFIVLTASYNIAAAAKGSVALGTGVSATFGVTGSTAGGFAVLHRFGDQEPAFHVFEDLFRSWGLPRHVIDANLIAPHTWIIAEVDGSIAMQVGIHAGYDFSWIRETPGGALKGDIGLRVQLGASAALGFEASGKYTLVLARESEQEILRLRLYKMARKGWTFAMDARAGINAELPPSFSQPHKAEDLVAAIFGLNQNQIIDVLRETRAFVNANVSLQDKLAGVLMDVGGMAIEQAAGFSEQQIRDTYEAGRKKVLDFVAKFDKLFKNAGHELTSMLLSLAPLELQNLANVLEQVAACADSEDIQELVREWLSKAGWERSPAGRFIEAAVGPTLCVISDCAMAEKVKASAGYALAVLGGETLEKLLDFIRRKLNVDEILAVATETDFDKMDNLLKARIADFLGEQELLMADLGKVQDAVRCVFKNVDQFYEMALKAARQKQEFAFTWRYARTTSNSALVDISFDTRSAANRDFLCKAIDGDLTEILLQETPGIRLNTAELTHNIAHNVSSELTMPFGLVSDSSKLTSFATLTVQEDNGRVLVYDLKSSSTESERSNLLFGARSGRDSTLTIAATLPLGVRGGVRIWRDDTFCYSYLMERAAVKMRASQFQEELAPIVAKYVPNAFSLPGARGFPEWVADLDKMLDNLDPNSGTHDMGDTLIALSLTCPSAYVRAWTRAPESKSDPIYGDLSRALQARLKELVTFYCFSDPARYRDLAAAAAPIVYSCIPVSTAIDVSGGTVRFNSGGIYWDQADVAEIKAMARDSHTKTALLRRMESISTILRGIPDLADVAPFYTPDQADTIIEESLHRMSPGSPIPELLGSLLFLEALLVDTAVKAGLEMARFQSAAPQKPTDALKHLANFGENLASVFNQTLGNHPLLSGASRPLTTLLFMEAAGAFDPTVSGSVDALLDVTVIRSGKLTIEEMLGGGIAVKPELILYEQPFVQAHLGGWGVDRTGG